MTANGNWKLLETIIDNGLNIQYRLPEALAKVNEDGDEIFHRFKIDVENSSGMFNRNESTITI